MSSYRFKTLLKTLLKKIFEFLKKQLYEILQRWVLMGAAAVFVIFVVIALVVWYFVASR